VGSPYSLGSPAVTLGGSLFTRNKVGEKLSVKAWEFFTETGVKLPAVNHHPVLDRTVIFDDAVKAYLDQHNEVVVANIGCGFCFRYFRLQHPNVKVWIDIDLPEVIQLKLKFYEWLKLEIDPYKYKTIAHNCAKGLDTNIFTFRIFEGSLPYIPYPNALALIKGDCLFDVLGPKRMLLGGDQLWRAPDNPPWMPYVKNSWEYDNIGNRQAIIYAVEGVK
jgi:hypothetical protein